MKTINSHWALMKKTTFHFKIMKEFIKKRLEHGRKERSDLKRWFESEAKKRKEDGSQNSDDYFNEITSTLIGWLKSSQLKPSGRTAFNRLLKLTFLMYDEILNLKHGPGLKYKTDSLMLEAYHDATLKTENELKELKKKRASELRELTKLRVQVDELLRTRQALLKEIEYYEEHN